MSSAQSVAGHDSFIHCPEIAPGFIVIPGERASLFSRRITSRCHLPTGTPRGLPGVTCAGLYSQNDVKPAERPGDASR